MRIIGPASNHRIPIVELDFYELEVQGLSAEKIIAFSKVNSATCNNRNGIKGDYFALWFPSDQFPKLHTREEVEAAVDAYQ